ncbi:MAG: COX15/CtaA family protein [Dehalococcoidia bacterium]
MTWFQRLLLVTIFLTFVLVVIGGAVRATDSGLGCPDWPTCHGKLIPKAEKHTLIEFSHRTAAAVVGVVFLGVTYFTFRTERRNPLVFWLAFSAGLLLVAQIVLGGITVKAELPAEIVAAHLATAMAFLGVLIVTAVVSNMRRRGLRAFALASDTTFTRLAVFASAATLATLILGSYISGTEASLACSGWPLCNGSLVPGGGSAEGLHFLHRLLAGVLGLLLAALVYVALDERRRQPLLLALCWAALAAYVAQALVGAANIWTELADGVVIAHLGLAALLWCLMVAISALSYYLPGEDARPEAADAPEADLAKVTQWAR